MDWSHILPPFSTAMNLHASAAGCWSSSILLRSRAIQPPPRGRVCLAGPAVVVVEGGRQQTQREGIWMFYRQFINQSRKKIANACKLTFGSARSTMRRGDDDVRWMCVFRGLRATNRSKAAAPRPRPRFGYDGGGYYQKAHFSRELYFRASRRYFSPHVDIHTDLVAARRSSTSAIKPKFIGLPSRRRGRRRARWLSEDEVYQIDPTMKRLSKTHQSLPRVVNNYGWRGDWKRWRKSDGAICLNGLSIASDVISKVLS